MIGANNREVAAVECRYLKHAETLGDGDQAGVNAAKSQVGVGLNQLGHPRPIRRCQSFNGQVPVGDRAVEPSLGGRSELTLDQPARLGNYQSGCGQRAGVVLEQRLAALVIGICVVGGSENNVGIDEQGQLPNPSANMSSSSAARRPFVDRPRLTKPSLRSGENRSVRTSAASVSGATPSSAAASATRSATPSSTSSVSFVMAAPVYEDVSLVSSRGDAQPVARPAIRESRVLVDTSRGSEAQRGEDPAIRDRQEPEAGLVAAEIPASVQAYLIDLDSN